MSGRIAVIGARGFLGQAIVATLMRGGHKVTGLGRHLPPGWPAGTVFQLCDASDPRALWRAVHEAGGIINAMAGPPRAVLRVARNLAICRDKGFVGPLVHISSLAVYGQSAGVLDEATTPQPARGHRYAHAKLAAEALVAGPNTRILRPGCLYGPAAPAWVDRLCGLLRTGRLGWLWDDGAGLCPLLHVEDMARLTVAALTADAGADGVHNLPGPEALTWNMYIRRLGVELGMSALPRISSTRLDAETYLHGPLRHALSLAGLPDAGPITPAMRRLFRSRARLVSRRAPLLPPDSVTTLDVGIKAAVADFRRRHPARASTAAPALGQTQAPA
jgi:nucleoside-diphosphate-sugar epimerase